MQYLTSSGITGPSPAAKSLLRRKRIRGRCVTGIECLTNNPGESMHTRLLGVCFLLGICFWLRRAFSEEEILCHRPSLSSALKATKKLIRFLRATNELTKYSSDNHSTRKFSGLGFSYLIQRFSFFFPFMPVLPFPRPGQALARLAFLPTFYFLPSLFAILNLYVFSSPIKTRQRMNS